MTALDRVNDRCGRGTLAMASTGTVKTQREWGIKQERCTPQYTSCWEEGPVETLKAKPDNHVFGRALLSARCVCLNL